ncbi:metallophosphoesterase [Bacillus piscicola]|uniref:metallophosphoesterase n=1 Tax=Bacillus piscicola TaxID=1632684 RepID=UPI001F089BE0|nr:metallophosphoesterase family protein [Bacillus piscicola]
MNFMKTLLGGTVLFGIYMWAEAHRNRIREEVAWINHLPDSFEGKKVFFISDIHTRLIPIQLISRIKGEADLVIIGGDLLEAGVSLKRVKTNLQRLREVAAVIFVWGNNDREQQKGLASLLIEENIITLENEIYEWKINQDSLLIAGLGDQHLKIDEAKTKHRGKKEVALLVTHDPASLHRLTRPDVFDTALTGHTHGGQIRLGPFAIREKAGWKMRCGIRTLISNGYGTSTLPLRLGAPAETHLLTLKKR